VGGDAGGLLAQERQQLDAAGLGAFGGPAGRSLRRPRLLM